MHIDLQPQLVHQDEFLKVEVDKNIKYIYVEWFTGPSAEEFRKSFFLAASIALEEKAEYWLSDARAIPFLDFADKNWVLREMTPKLLESPLKKYARLSTKESIGLLDIHRIYSALSSQQAIDFRTKFETFTSREAALEWLFLDFEQD